MSLLRRIQDATVDPMFELADILRMCKILAARLDHSAFKQWIDWELNGYVECQDNLPKYRIFEGLGCRGDFFGSFGSRLKNSPIPLMSLPDKFRDGISTKYIFQSVSALASIVKQADQSNTSMLRSPWPADAVALFGSGIFENMVCGQAWTDIPTAEFVAVLDTVKSRILDFAIEIEAENSSAGDAELGEKPIPDAVTSNIFYNCILQQHQTVSSGSIVQKHNQGEIHMSENYTNNLQGANVANMANVVRDEARQQANQYIHQPQQKQALAEAAEEIQKLLKDLETARPRATQLEKVAYVNDETTPSFKRRLAGVLRASGESAIDEFILENKYLKVAKAAIKGWLQPHQ